MNMKLFTFLIDRLKKWWVDESYPHLLRGFLLWIWHGLRLPVTLAHNVKRLMGSSVKGFSEFHFRSTGDAVLLRRKTQFPYFKGQVPRKLRPHSLLLLTLFFGFMQNAMADATWFITKWETTTVNETITIPVQSLTYNYDIDCDNNSTFEQTGVTGDGTCTYATAGQHIINIRGTFPAININNGTEKDKILEVMQWGTITWESMESAFNGASNLQITATDSPDLSNVTNMTAMFANATAFNSDISSWNVSNVTLMTEMFVYATAFNSDISGWNVSNVTDMSYMFQYATAFNSDISSWNVSNVTSMSGMFYGTTAFNSDISSWNVSNVTTMSYMFYNATAFNQDLSSWNVSNVTDMSYMFENAIAFNSDLSSWNVSNVTSMSGMFFGATAFNQDLSSWNVSNMTSMAQMFYGATAFNQDLSSWDVSNVTIISSEA